MAIKPIIPNIPVGKNLVPKTEYQGPILKLTKNEQAKIKKLQESAITLEIEQIKLNDIIKSPHISNKEKYPLLNKLDKIEHWLEKIKEEIQNIKIERLKQQKAKLLK